MFLNRSRPRGPDPFLEARMALFMAGALMGFVGILRDGEGWWVSSAIGLLAGGMILSVVESMRRRRAAERDEDQEGEGEEEWEKTPGDSRP